MAILSLLLLLLFLLLLFILFVVVIFDVDPRKLPLKFGQNRVSNRGDIANNEIMVGGLVGGGGVQSHFFVIFNLGYVMLG